MPTARHIIHVDMDAFYASVEQLDDPSLKGKPVIVGGSPKARGVVSAASYPARKFGVHSAMPMSRAVRLCPDATVLPVRMKRYAEISAKIHEIFAQFTPEIEPISLDEAFLDITGSTRLFGPPEKIAQNIKSKIKQQLNLIASVGIAPNKFLAKLASDLDKPDGFVVITEQTKQKILDPLPIKRIWGLGKVTCKSLNNIGINTIKQLHLTHPDHLKSILGNQTDHILQLARGIDDRSVQSTHTAKSISCERTFPKDIKDKDTLLSILHEQTAQVARRLRKQNFQAKTITLKLRHGDFKTITRSTTLEKPTNITEVLWQQAKATFTKWHKKSPAPLRLLGFGASNLIEENTGQQSLFTDPEEQKQKRLDQALDKITTKHGQNALKKADSDV